MRLTNWAGLILGALALALISAGCGDDSPPSERIDEVSGSFRGITIGDPSAALGRLDGECEETDNIAPCGENAERITEPHTLPGEWRWRFFPEATFFTGPEGIKGFLVTRSSLERSAAFGVYGPQQAANLTPHGGLDAFGAYRPQKSPKLPPRD
jgi:hypothetical protein